jgi:hypothetical protein
VIFDAKAHARNRILDLWAEGKFDDMVEALPESKQGIAEIDHMQIGPAQMLHSMARSGEEFVPPGTYARLKINGETMMTNTPMELRTNLDVIEHARGRVLIAGLGMGMILRSILRKPEVTHVTVLEKYRDVIDLVMPSLAGLATHCPLEALEADVFEWKWPTHLAKFHTIYFDIWPSSSQRHIPEMEALYKRYRPLLAKGGWMDSWTYSKLKVNQKANRKFLRDLPGMLEGYYRESTHEQFADRVRALLNYADELQLIEAEKEVIRRFAAGKGLTL